MAAKELQSVAVTTDNKSLVLRALEELAGPALILDEELHIVGYTQQAPALVGGAIPLGVFAPKLLCGSGSQRPIAEAMARGEPVSAEIQRPQADGQTRMVQVRATPMHETVMGEQRRCGWLLMLDADAFTVEGEEDNVNTWGILTRDAGMKQLLRQLSRVAQTNASVLIRGETGSGKELVARAIHEASPRKDGPFRALNCAALPPALLESELFGHVRGAFTGAVRNAPGHFRSADGGTLFLDEVAELPLEMQAKLLRVLQERTVLPVGGSEAVPVDTRIISATHRSLRGAVQSKLFRADLMYRLRVVPLFIPPLRERVSDIELLVRHFLEVLGGEGSRQVQRIAPGALRVLEEYEWPGNVRELQNAIEYALVMGDGPVLTEAELPQELISGDPMSPAVNIGAPPAKDLPKEAAQLLTALERAGGHQGRAAQSLGLSRVTLWRKLRRYGLDKASLAEKADA